MRTIVFLVAALIVSPAVAEQLAAEAVVNFRYIDFFTHHYGISYSFGERPDPDVTNAVFFITDETIGTTQRVTIPRDSYINLVYHQPEWDWYTLQYLYHYFQFVEGYLTTISTQPKTLLEGFEILPDPNEPGSSLIHITPHISTPNGFNLYGTGLYFSAIEFEHTGVLSNNGLLKVDGVFRFFVAPEPSTLVLGLSLAMCFPIQRFRRAVRHR